MLYSHASVELVQCPYYSFRSRSSLMTFPAGVTQVDGVVVAWTKVFQRKGAGHRQPGWLEESIFRVWWGNTLNPPFWGQSWPYSTSKSRLIPQIPWTIHLLGYEHWLLQAAGHSSALNSISGNGNHWKWISQVWSSLISPVFIPRVSTISRLWSYKL